MNYLKMSAECLLEEKIKAEAEYNELKKCALSLDLSRGKPGKKQIDMMTDMLTCVATAEDCICENGTDCRNYGILESNEFRMCLCTGLLYDPSEHIIVDDPALKNQPSVTDSHTK